ncbi:MAG: MFS transporter [bacterium]
MPYTRLSTFYFFYFAALGALVPYWGLYLQTLGFDSLAIGSLMAILMATKVVAPFLWGWLGDHLGHRMVIVRGASLISLFTFAGMFWSKGYWEIALVMVLFSFFWNASLPQFEVVTLKYLGSTPSRYARVRLWGSVGFILMVASLGALEDRHGVAMILPAVLFAFVGIFLASLLVKDPEPVPHPLNQDHLLKVLMRPAILAFFAAVFLMQMSHGPYYAFYSIFMVENGYSKTVIGQLWALGVAAEVAFFLVSHRVLDRWGARKVLMLSLALASLRWLLLGQYVDSMAMMVLVQCLHAATFGSFHAAAIHLVHHYFQGKHQGRGQAIYSSVSFGAGGAAGSLLAGASWDAMGAVNTYYWASLAAMLGALVIWRFVDGKHDF